MLKLIALSYQKGSQGSNYPIRVEKNLTLKEVIKLDLGIFAFSDYLLLVALLSVVIFFGITKIGHLLKSKLYLGLKDLAAVYYSTADESFLLMLGKFLAMLYLGYLLLWQQHFRFRSQTCYSYILIVMLLLIIILLLFSSDVGSGSTITKPYAIMKKIKVDRLKNIKVDYSDAQMLEFQKEWLGVLGSCGKELMKQKITKNQFHNIALTTAIRQHAAILAFVSALPLPRYSTKTTVKIVKAALTSLEESCNISFRNASVAIWDFPFSFEQFLTKAIDHISGVLHNNDRLDKNLAELASWAINLPFSHMESFYPYMPYWDIFEVRTILKNLLEEYEDNGYYILLSLSLLRTFKTFPANMHEPSIYTSEQRFNAPYRFLHINGLVQRFLLETENPEAPMVSNFVITYFFLFDCMMRRPTKETEESRIVWFYSFLQNELQRSIFEFKLDNLLFSILALYLPKSYHGAYWKFTARFVDCNNTPITPNEKKLQSLNIDKLNEKVKFFKKLLEEEEKYYNGN